MDKKTLELSSTEVSILRDALEDLLGSMPDNRYEHYVDDDNTPVTEEWFDRLWDKLDNA